MIFHGVLSENELLEIASKCSFAVNPVFSGGGSNVKNADYLALGLPILTTNFGIRGFEKYKKFIEIRSIQRWRDFEKNQVPISIRRKMSWNNSLKTFMETLSI